MPRQPRIDISGLLHHVIFRRIDRCKIVKDDSDRLGFVLRLGQLAEECRTPVYAWALLDNHYHLLVLSSDYGLPRFMRRLLTGHAISFNLRHKRHGHPFQNRYKSIICEEDSYFLELVRYIHLNPLRAGQVKDLPALKDYPWCGHATLMGEKTHAWQDRDEVLAHFGRKAKQAVEQYEQFVGAGIPQGKRPELVGGGLRCSQANNADDQTAPEAYDERILGAGDFVEQILNQTEQNTIPFDRQESLRKGEVYLQQTCKRYSVTPQELLSGSRRQPVSNIRKLVVTELIHNFGWTTTNVARALGLSSPAISKILSREKTERG